VYFVQSGAYSREEDAEAARAKLAMQGFAAKITEREQSGRPVYRVRLGPYDFKDDAESYQNKLQAAGSEAAIVRIFKQ
jgi:cell division protein FtsN